MSDQQDTQQTNEGQLPDAGVEFTYDEATRTFHALNDHGDLLEYKLADDETYNAEAGLIEPAGTAPASVLVVAAKQEASSEETPTGRTLPETAAEDVKPEATEPKADGGDAAAADIPQTATSNTNAQAQAASQDSAAAPVDPAPQTPPAAPVDAGASGQVVAQAAPTAATASGNEGTPEGATARLQALTTQVPADTAAMLHTVLDYMKKMKPKVPGTQDEQVRHQVSLYRALTGIINRTEEDFNKVWTTLLAVFHEHRDGVFHERFVFRHAEHIPLSATDRSAFHNILNMMKLTADPASRNVALKQLDFQKTTQHGLNDAGRNKLGAFYNL